MWNSQGNGRPAVVGSAIVQVTWLAFAAVGIVAWPCGGMGADDIAGATSSPISAAARELHHDSLVFDAHNNLVMSLLKRKDVTIDSIDLTRFQQGLHTDLPRLKQGGVGAEMFATFVSTDSVKKGEAVRRTLEQIENIKRLLARYPQNWELARSVADIERLRRERKVAGLITIENGDAIDGSLAVLRSYYAAGVRCMALSHDDSHGWADAALDKALHDGLSDFGKQVVSELNRLGVVIDLSHASTATIQDTLEVSRAPVIFSHSGAHGVAPHARNLTDDVLKKVAVNGGVVQVNFFAGFLTAETVAAYDRRSREAHEMRKAYKNDEQYRLALQQWLKEHPLPTTSVKDVVDHIEHVVKVAGIDHVGLGSNFDGIVSVPRDLDDVSCYPRITQELLRRGYQAEQIRKILGLNTLRVLREVERVAASTPSDVGGATLASREATR